MITEQAKRDLDEQWRLTVLATACPFCGAPAGSKCVSLKGGRRDQFHSARLRALKS